MYTIGDFSRINRISTKTLRHYDRIGLFKPAKVDEWTGYRYYEQRQQLEIARILELRDLGFTLDEIKRSIRDDSAMAGSLESQIGKLEKERVYLGRRIEKAREYLELLKTQQTGIRVPELKPLPGVIVASMRTRIPCYDTFFDIVPKMGDYMRSVGAVCREPPYCFTIYHDGEYRDSDIDVEICEAVVAHCRESDRVKFKTIDEVPLAACLMHKGPYSTFHRTYNALFGWIPANGYRAVGNPRESYIDGIWNKDDPEDWLTEVQVPIERDV